MNFKLQTLIENNAHTSFIPLLYCAWDKLKHYKSPVKDDILVEKYHHKYSKSRRDEIYVVPTALKKRAGIIFYQYSVPMALKTTQKKMRQFIPFLV